jgi:hypothetical protein
MADTDGSHRRREPHLLDRRPQDTSQSGRTEQGKTAGNPATTSSGDLSRQVALVWNRKMAEVRPAIAKYSRLLPAMFRLDGR